MWGKIGLGRAEKFCGRMQMGLKAGVDILRVLETEANTRDRRHSQAVSDVRRRITQGDTLAEALRHRDDYFRDLMIRMAEAGDRGGGLDRIFGHLAAHYRELLASRRSFVRQMTRPVLSLLVAIGVLSLLIYLMGVLFNDTSQTSYDPLGFGLRGARGVMIFWGYLVAGFGAVFLVIFAVWKNWFGLHQILMPLAIKLPVIGSVLKNSAMSRLTMVLSLLLNAGVDVMAAVRQAFVATHNGYYIAGMNKTLAAARRNQSLATSFEAAGVLPRDFIEALDVGELSGNETESLESLSGQYGEAAGRSMQQFATLCATAVYAAITAGLVLLIFRMFLNYVNLLNRFM